MPCEKFLGTPLKVMLIFTIYLLPIDKVSYPPPAKLPTEVLKLFLLCI